MPDYIKRSIDLHEWLKAQGVTVEPDEFAPKVWQQKTTRRNWDMYYVRLYFAGGEDELVCPYYGPGGSDNSLKALRALVKKNGWRLVLANKTWMITNPKGLPGHRDNFILAEAEHSGKTDGIALAELLWKLKEESK